MTVNGDCWSRLRRLPERVRRRLRALRDRARYRLGLPEARPPRCELADGFVHVLDRRERTALVARYRQSCPDAVATEIAAATQYREHRFAMLGHQMAHGERIAWARDPVSGHDWPPAYSPDIRYHGPARLGDIKLPWELNKHQYFFTLGKAAWLTGDESFADEIIRQIDDWLVANPYRRGIHWISALEIGARVISWVLAYPFYAERTDAAFRRRLVDAVAVHVRFVEAHLSTGPYANTHLVGEAAAMVVGGLFVDCQASRRWVERGIALLERELRRQLTRDGVHVERSVGYHRFFLDHYYLVDALLAANGRAFGAATRAGMERATSYLRDAIAPSGAPLAFGDADEARGLWVHRDSSRDYRALLALAAVTFDRPEFLDPAGGSPEELLWLLGERGLARFERLRPRPPQHLSAAYPDGGYYFLRSGWAAHEAVLAVDCGPLGFGPAGHGHADALSIQLHAAGYPFLVDAGTFSYNLDYRWRNRFRGTRAHNTLTVDGADQSDPSDRMSWRTQAVATARFWISEPRFDVLVGEHDGYARFNDPVLHRRVVVCFRPHTWWIWDELACRQQHDWEARWHLLPDCEVRAMAADRFELRSPGGAQLHLWTPVAGAGRGAVTHVTGGEEETGAWYSPEYGVRIPAQALVVRGRTVGPLRYGTMITASAAARPFAALIDDAYHCGVERDGGTESLLYRPQLTGRSEWSGHAFDGDLVYLDRPLREPPVVRASAFRELRVPGLLEVRAPSPLTVLELSGRRCTIRSAAGDPRPQVALPGGYELWINEQAVAPSRTLDD